MAVQAGVLFFDNRSIDDALQAIVAGLKPWAPDGVSAVTGDGAVLAYGARHVWAGERGGRQPFRSPSGLAITWDGRIDNRNDLVLTLRTPPREASDAAIALAVFEQLGADGLRLIVGEWSLVIWDAHQRTVHLARDYMGVRPLYYHERAGHAVAWSTSLGELALRTGCADVLDERFVARFMTLRHSTAVTPYRGIRAVPTAHCVSVSAQRGEQTHRFWQFEPRSVTYRDRRFYEEQLRALWREAVEARLRVDGTVWAELSGGLDSSSVVCMADALIRYRSVSATAIRPLSHVATSSPEADERRFIGAVETQIGTPTSVVAIEESQHRCDADTDWVTPFALRGVGLAAVQRVRDAGGRLILSGRAGDAVMGCIADNSVAVFDDLEAGRVLNALSAMRRWSRATRKPFIEIVLNLIRDGLPAAFLLLAAPSRTETQERGADLLTPRLRASAGEAPDIGLAVTVAGMRRSKRPLARLLLGYAVESRLNLPHLPLDITYAYPFVHRPLVEFVMAIPGEELSLPGETRSLMRRSFEGLVPRAVLTRTSKGYYPPAAIRAIRPLAAAARPVERLEVVQRGWIDAKNLDAAIRVVVDGGGATGAEVRRVLRLEQWLHARHRRGPAAIPNWKEVRSHEVLNA